jgi:hypothetical protein
MGWLWAAVAAVALAGAAWEASGWAPARRPRAAAEPPVWDLGPSPGPARLALARWGCAAGIGAGALLATHNLVASAILGVGAHRLPDALVARWRLARRHRLDVQAYALANTARLLLPLAENVVTAITEMLPQTEPPLQDILAFALQQEAREVGALTEAIRAVGLAVGLPDLALFGDILLQVRTQAPQAAELLHHLVAVWGERLQQEQRRLGRITGSARLGAIMVAASLAAQVGWPLVSPGARAADGALAGQLLGGLGALLTTAAWLVLERAQRRALEAAA